MKRTTYFSKKIFKIVFSIFFVLAIINTIYYYYYIKGVSDFCESIISPVETPASVIKRAFQYELVVTGDLGEKKNILSGNLMIFNQISPLGRFSCVIKYKNGKIIGKEVIEAD